MILLEKLSQRRNWWILILNKQLDLGLWEIIVESILVKLHAVGIKMH